GAHATALVRNYVQAGVNAPSSPATNAFTFPDNLALDRSGNLYITEDPGGETPSKTIGDDIWMATPDKGQTGLAGSVVRFATLTDCNAEPTGIYFGKRGPTSLLVNIQHRGGDGLDKSLAITAGTE
ncbi:MAG TPA: alkaline phosphatase PhoX, partial [Gemmatimonadales bacterium]|nr:alkaline phosphatase PhoX [Gemmatimonadales bacterium]